MPATTFGASVSRDINLLGRSSAHAWNLSKQTDALLALTYSMIDVNPAQHVGSSKQARTQYKWWNSAKHRQDITKQHEDSLMPRMPAMADATCALVAFDMLLEEVACTTIGNVVVVAAAAAGAGAATAGAGAGTPVAWLHTLSEPSLAW